MAAPVTLLCRPDLHSADVTVKNTFIDGHGEDSDAEPAQRARYATCPGPDVSPSLSETTAPGESPVSETPDSTLTSSSGPSTSPQMEAKMPRRFFKTLESDSSTPRDHHRNSMQSEISTPRGERPGTMEQWPEYPKQSTRQPWAPPAQPQNPSATPYINLCSALPSAHPSHPAVACPVAPAGMVYPGAFPVPYPACFPYPMATPYPVPRLPQQLPPMWNAVDPLVQAQQAAALAVAVTAASLCPVPPAPVTPMPVLPLPHGPHVPHVPHAMAPELASLASLQAETPELPLPADAGDEGEERKPRSRRARLWAHIYLRMQQDGFDLVPRLIGRKGCNMRRIAEQTSAKVRIRGQGSGHLEIDGKYEAPTPLMIAVTTDHADPEMFKRAMQMTLKVLKAVEGCYRAFCTRNGIEHSGPCYCVGFLQPKAQEALGSLLDSVPQNLEEPQTTNVKSEPCQ
ncbi:HET-E1 [Symbiodinium sp. CCMP2456]|nr:HET-E1 [Symbiodinium sp. CCMP2456]